MRSIWGYDMVEIIAHRGFSGKYPENTLLAIRKAIEIGVDGVEIDAWISLDNRPVVIHDPRLNRTTNGRGRVLWKTLEEIKKYRTDKRKQEVPSLEEVFPLIRKGTFLNIEIKNMWSARPVADVIKKCEMQGVVLLSSSSLGALRVVQNALPSSKRAYLFYTHYNSRIGVLVTAVAKTFSRITQALIIRNARLAGAEYVHLSYPFATKSFIKRLHKKGFKVNVWTVNTKPLMRKLIKNGIDGIITNNPDLLKSVLSKKSKKKKLSLRKLGKKIRIPKISLRRKK